MNERSNMTSIGNSKPDDFLSKKVTLSFKTNFMRGFVLKSCLQCFFKNIENPKSKYAPLCKCIILVSSKCLEIEEYKPIYSRQ